MSSISGDKIKEIRFRVGISQQELAEKLGVSKQFISQVENGKANLSGDKERLLLSLYRVSLYNDSVFIGNEINNCVPIPFITASCGGGSYNIELETMPVPVSELQKFGIRPKDLLLVKVQGTSMSPLINHNDVLVLSTFSKTPIDGEIYALNYDNKILCKRILVGAKYIILKSENVDYPSEKIEGDEKEKLNIIGRVIFRMNFIGI